MSCVEPGQGNIPSDWMNDETSPTAIATATETPPIVSQLPLSLPAVYHYP